MRRLSLGAILLAAGLGTAACGGSAPQGTAGSGGGSGGASGPIKIGSIHPLTGPLAGDGQQMDNAVKLAVEEINAAGGIKALNGTKLEVVSGDSQGKPEVGQSEAQRVISSGAAALVGTYQTAVTANVSSVAERSQVPLVIDVAVADSLLQQGYKYSFRIQPNASAMGTQGARYLQEISKAAGTPVEKVAYMHEQTDFGVSVQKAFAAEAQKLGMTVDPVLSYDALKASDLTTEVTRVKAADADVLTATGYYRDGVLIANNVASVRPAVQGVFGVANGAFDLPQFPKDTGPAGEGYLDTNYHYDAKDAETQRVRAAFNTKYGQEMRTAAVLSYEAVRVIARGLEQGKDRNPQKLRDAIAGVQIDDPIMAFAGPIAFDQTGQNKNAIPIVMQVQGGTVKQVHPQEFAEAPPKFPAVPGR